MPERLRQHGGQHHVGATHDLARLADADLEAALGDAVDDIAAETEHRHAGGDLFGDAEPFEHAGEMCPRGRATRGIGMGDRPRRQQRRRQRLRRRHIGHGCAPAHGKRHSDAAEVDGSAGIELPGRLERCQAGCAENHDIRLLAAEQPVAQGPHSVESSVQRVPSG